MNDPSSMSAPMTSSATPSAISSPASASGPTSSEAADGTMSAQSGPARVHASRLARLASRRNRHEMLDTSGRPSLNSSRSAALQWSLENRLWSQMEGRGSPMFVFNWRRWLTPSELPISALRAWVRPTSANDSFGWPTPTSRDWKDSPGMNVEERDLLGRAVYAVTNHRRTASGATQTGCSVTMHSGVRLNPAHSRWLMGLPPAWDECAPTETPSSRPSPRSS